VFALRCYLCHEKRKNYCKSRILCQLLIGHRECKASQQLQTASSLFICEICASSHHALDIRGNRPYIESILMRGQLADAIAPSKWSSVQLKARWSRFVKRGKGTPEPSNSSSDGTQIFTPPTGSISTEEGIQETPLTTEPAIEHPKVKEKYQRLSDHSLLSQ